MKKIVIFTLLLLTTFSVTAQFGGQRRNSRLGRQTPNVAPNENQKAQMEKKAAENQAEYIDAFLNTLEADDFQKEILNQTITDFYAKLPTFAKFPFSSNLERKEAFESFKSVHFKEVKTLISEDDSQKLTDFLEGKFKKNDSDKKKKKKRKRRNKDDDN